MISSSTYSLEFRALSKTSIHFWSSDWGNEWAPHCVSAESILNIAVTTGRSSKGHHPFIIIEDGSQAHFMAIAWSGNWRITCTPIENQISIHIETDCIKTEILQKTVSIGGINSGMKEFVTSFRALDLHKKPKLLTEWNSWWPYEDSDINETVFLANAIRAKDAGIEVAVLDAGWFGPSLVNSQWHQLRGDWDQRNFQRFPSGIRNLAQAVRAMGIEFGIWLEVEALGEDAHLAQTHSNFIAQRDGRNLGYICLANPDAFLWACTVSKNLVDECEATWIKMDFNVDPGAGCNRADHGHNSTLGLNEHIHNLYALLDILKRDYPDLTIENCSSGGLRWDIAMATHVDLGFTSDPDWPEHSLSCFWASSLFFPPEKLLGWCDSQWRGDHPNQQFSAIDSADTDLEFALSITLLGGFGISARLPDFTEGKLELLQDYVNIYKSFFRPRFQDSAFINHLTPQPARELKGCRTVAFAIESVNHDPLLTIYQLDGATRLNIIEYLPPKPEAYYRISNLVNGTIIHHSHQGVLVFQNTLLDNTSILLEFEEISGESPQGI